jgi:salicylate hydroxylase
LNPSFSLQPNGLRVLALIPGFDADKIPGQYIDKSTFRSWIPEEEATLAESDFPAKVKSRFGYQMKGVDRTGFRRLIVQTAKDHGVEIHWEHSLVSLEQGADEVSVKFENGHTDTASFVIGCDGLHSNTRASIFGREKAEFTGLTQVCNPSHVILYLIDNSSKDSWRKSDGRGILWKIRYDQYLRERSIHGRLSH